jgi:hypothetical protein
MAAGGLVVGSAMADTVSPPASHRVETRDGMLAWCATVGA